jgi:RNA recognition motif-containing protein
MDRGTGRSKGFGFVEMKTDQEAQAVIAGLNGQMSGGRSLTVNEAKPREDRAGRGAAAARRVSRSRRPATSQGACPTKTMTRPATAAGSQAGSPRPRPRHRRRDPGEKASRRTPLPVAVEIISS